MENLIPSDLKPRSTYIAKLLPFVGKNIIKVLTGQRRVGKSYILFQLMQHIQIASPATKIVYINLEDMRYDTIRTYRDLYNSIIEEIGSSTTAAVFIDEIQEVEGFEKAIRSLMLRPATDIYITGSNSTMLSSELATNLSGRYIEQQVMSLDYTEFLEFMNFKDSPQSFEKYIQYGGMPYLVNIALTPMVAGEYLQMVYNTVVLHDVIARYSVRNVSFMDRLIRFTADNIGNLFTAKNISDYQKSQGIKMEPNLVINYMRYLTDSFLISKVDRYNIIGKRRFEIGEKYYFGDIGIRNVLVGYNPQSRGQILENIVYNNLKFRGYDVAVGVIGAKEVDFVAQKDNEKLYVQVALSLKDGDTIEREYGNLTAIDDNYPKYVITLDDFHGNTYQGIKTMSIREFLLRDDVLD